MATGTLSASKRSATGTRSKVQRKTKSSSSLTHPASHAIALDMESISPAAAAAASARPSANVGGECHPLPGQAPFIDLEDLVQSLREKTSARRDRSEGGDDPEREQPAPVLIHDLLQEPVHRLRDTRLQPGRPP